MDDGFFILGKVNSVPLSFLLDIGANITIISPQVVKKASGRGV